MRRAKNRPEALQAYQLRLDETQGPVTAQRECRVCHCTEKDRRAGEVWWWVEVDLCSDCKHGVRGW